MKDGGPAFPQMTQHEIVADDGYRKQWWPEGGMSLRDYFAGQALASTEMPTWMEDRAEAYAKWAACCYKMADAMMIEARKR